MKILEIKKYPDSVLRQRCELVREITPQEVQLFEDMLFTMYNSRGIGLAGSQVGIPRRIIVADVGEGIIKLANPRILEVKRKKDRMVEGCLSVPDINVEIARPYEILVAGLNEKNEMVELEVRGLMARVIQHEIDHLEGKLITDYMGLLQKIRLRRSKSRNR